MKRNKQKALHLLGGALLSAICTFPVVHALELPEILSEEELDLIQERLIYTVGYSNATIPMSYTLHGNLTGVSIEMMKDFSQMSCVIFDFIDMDDPRNQEISVDMSLKMDNFSDLIISEPFLVVPTILVQKSSFEGEVHSLGIMDSLGLIDPFEILEGKTVTEYEVFSQLEQAVLKEEIDGMVISTLRYPYIATEVDNYILKTTLLSDMLEYNIYFSEGFPQDKIDIFNKMIKAYGEERFDYLVAKHSNYATATMTTVEMLTQNFTLIMGSFLVGTGLVTCVVVFYQVRQRKKLLRQMEYDPLTGLYSERKFIEETIRLLQENKTTYTLLVFDVDNFKYINEMYGYETGSNILQELGHKVKEILPDSTPIARSYGDNFMILLHEGQTRQMASNDSAYFEELSIYLRNILQKEYEFNFSLGLYPIKNAMEDVSLMIDSATFARDKGKETMGITVHFYDEAMMQERSNNNMITVTMHDALHHREFQVYYQPKFDLKTKETIGAEALVRWQRGDKLLPPTEFIPIFEKNGFIEKLDYYVLETVCRFIHAHELEGVPRISVNLSAVTVQQEDLVEKIEQVLQSTRVSPFQIDLEVTESAFVEKFEQVFPKLDILRAMGFTISMDDFGAGSSSLNRLKGIPLDVLKIDREFIVDSLENEKGRAIIKNVVQMAMDLGLETVAEGIETQEQLAFLRDLGCQVGQGYVYARPLPQQEFLKPM